MEELDEVTQSIQVFCYPTCHATKRAREERAEDDLCAVVGCKIRPICFTSHESAFPTTA